MDPNHKKPEHKPITIIVNGREKEWFEKEISFKQVVELAFGIYEENDFIIYTVTFKGPGNQEGTMVVSDTVKVKKGMVFNVTKTDKS